MAAQKRPYDGFVSGACGKICGFPVVFPDGLNFESNIPFLAAGASPSMKIGPALHGQNGFLDSIMYTNA